MHPQPEKIRPGKEVWVFIALALASALVLLNYVNLVPRVDNNFFFSNSDPQFQDEKLISRLFVRRDTILIINAAGPIDSSEYYQKINNLCNSILKLRLVTGVKSITLGPANLENALSSPLWQRLLIAKDHKSTNVIVILQDTLSTSFISALEKLVSRSDGPDFHLIMSGPPYIVELISRQLLKDIKVFSLMALIIFSVVIYFIFRSRSILLGAIVSCVSASMWTLMIIHIMGIKIGLLTANIATIVFVLTLSHIIFLTYNWKYLSSQADNTARVQQAASLTFSPSFWCMSTALLGFFSLLLVPAQPLKELGASGIIASFVAISVAYCIYPAFLRMAHPLSGQNLLDRYQQKAERFLEQKKNLLTLGVCGLFLAVLPGLWRVNTDPSLFTFFKKDSQIEKGLTYIDRHGGSSPLILVIKKADGAKLDTEDAYQQLWRLQTALEKNSQVGTIVSLPVLMSEVRRFPLASFLSFGWLLDILKLPHFNEIARSFITDDHKEGLFMLRMNESHRKVSRLKIIHELEKTVTEQGFVIERVGGIYSMHGHLSKLVASSVVFGLGQLILIFAVIAWIVSRSIPIAFAITMSICVIPVIVFGTIGLLSVPLDVVSAPACNIAIGLGIDSMIHMVRAHRMQRKEEKDDAVHWQKIRHRFWQPIVTFTLTMVLGFGIFMFSDFPSTQRFGAAVVFGTVIAALTALFIMPSLSLCSFARQHNSGRPE